MKQVYLSTTNGKPDSSDPSEHGSRNCHTGFSIHVVSVLPASSLKRPLPKLIAKLLCCKMNDYGLNCAAPPPAQTEKPHHSWKCAARDHLQKACWILYEPHLGQDSTKASEIIEPASTSPDRNDRNHSDRNHV